MSQRLFDLRLEQSTKSRYLFSVVSIVAVIVLLFIFPAQSRLLHFFWINGVVVLAVLLAIQGFLWLRKKPATLILEFVAIVDLIDLILVDGVTRVYLGSPFTPIFILSLVNLGSGYLFYFFCYEGKRLYRRNLMLSGLFVSAILVEDLLLGLYWGNGSLVYSLLKIVAVLALYAFLIRFAFYTVVSLREQARHNQVLNDRLVSSLRFVVSGELFTSILHDLKNNLHNVFLSIDFLKITRGDPEKQAFATQAMESEIEKVREVMDAFLGYVRMENVEHTPLPVHQILGQSLDFLRVSRKSLPKLDLNIPAPPHDPGCLVLASRYRLFSIFLNLLDNAVHSLEHSGQEGEKILSIRVVRHGGEVHVTIQDNGPGIPPERLGGLFDMNSTKAQGSGIGLHLTRDYIENKLGGRIQVSSVPFRETRFVVALPVAADEAPAVPRAQG